MNKKIITIGGGTISWVRNHLALSAPAYGTTALKINDLCTEAFPDMDNEVFLTRMCGNMPGPRLETTEDISKFVDDLVDNLDVKIIFFSVSMIDWNMKVLDGHQEEGKYAPRVQSSEVNVNARLTASEKIIRRIRRTRKDIFLVGFKQTCGLESDAQYRAGLKLCKQASCNLVLANDTETRNNMIITPEEARYHETTDRDEALKQLVDMTKLRSHLTFTRSTVIAGEPVPWDSDLVPHSLRSAVNYCIIKGAYKPFLGSTVGHFACKLDDQTFLTSKRKTNFIELSTNGLVKIKTDGPDTVLAYGAKPSVGGQSQRIVFKDHPGMDCILHFHCPIKPGSKVPQRSQREYECGSHQCGQNTSDGLEQFGNLKAVYLDNHGPNIVFNRDIDPQEIMDFIDENFDLMKKTGGPVSSGRPLVTA